jgi:VanZ family protein
MIILGSLLKVPDVDVGIQHNDKLLHFLAYFILAGWFVQLYHTQSTRILIVLFAVALGLVLEFLQGTISYRSFDWIDVMANTLGALTAYLLAGTAAFSSALVYIDHKLYQLIHQPD